MRVAAFREEPHAANVASILHEQGYDTEIVTVNGKGDGRALELCEAIRGTAWAAAFLISNCELEYFEHLVSDNFGSIVWHHRPARA